MLDGADVVTLRAPAVDRLLDLYTRRLGFTVVAAGPLDRPDDWREIWGTSGSGPLSAWLLAKPGSHGGRLRVVRDPAATADDRPASIARIGPHALDFYVRDLPALHDELTDDWAFRSPPQRYALFGTDFAVTECLLEAPLGLVHALVDYLPGRHRCVLGTDGGQRVSEVVAVVHVVPAVDEALGLLAGVLGGEVYLDETFGGAEVGRIMGLDAGTTFRMALVRGPGRRNARIEVIGRTDQAGADPTPTAGPAVVLTCPVPDLTAARERLRAMPGLRVSEPGPLGFGVTTPFGMTLHLTTNPVSAPAVAAGGGRSS